MTPTRTRPVPGRVRIVGWIIAVAALGLLLLILAVSVALRATVTATIRDNIAQEAGEIRRFSTTGLDPATGRPFLAAQRFVEVYLARQQPDPAELLVGGVRGIDTRIEQRGALAPTFGDLDVATRTRILEPNSEGTLTSPTHGRITWRTVEIQSPEAPGWIAVIALHGPRESMTRSQLGMLVLLALGALLATALVAWLVSGRLVKHTQQFEDAISGGANGLTEGAQAAVAREQQFSDDLAHELRTPLAILRGSLEQPGETIEQRNITRDRVLAEVIRLQDLIGDLVVINRADRPDYVQVGEPVPVAEFVEELVALWSERLAEPGAPAVRVVAGALVPGVALAIDEPRLARAVDELVGNALRASAHGGTVWVGTTTRTDEDGTEWFCLDVSDTGRGLPAEERDHVRERFARASNDPDPGVGLGLTVADRLVAAMGGRLAIYPNAESPGATARIEFPRAMVHAG